MPHWTVLTLLTLLLPIVPLSAQAPAVPPGSLVRVRLACAVADARRPCAAVIGRLLVQTGDSLLLEDEHGVRHRIDLAAGAQLERNAGYRRHTLLGLGLGALAGLASGAVLASRCTQGGRGEDDEFCTLNYLVTVPVGVGLGTLVGALTRTERWEIVSPAAAALTVWPLAGRTTVAVGVHF